MGHVMCVIMAISVIVEGSILYKNYHCEIIIMYTRHCFWYILLRIDGNDIQY